MFVFLFNEKVNLLFIFFFLFGRSTIQRSSFESTLNFHIVGFDEGPSDMHMLTFLKTMLFFLDFKLAALGLGNLASVSLPILPSKFHPE